MDSASLRRLQKILKFSVENATASTEEAKNDRSLDELEDKKWLSDAMSAYMGPSDVEVMKACLQIIAIPNADNETIENALEVLEEKIEDIDNAKDFVKIGGIPLAFRMLDGTLCWRAAQLLAVLVQNNPFCQEAVLAGGGLEKLLTLGKRFHCGDLALLKIVYALSSLTRNCDKALRRFIEQGGIDFLVEIFRKGNEKLITKVLFMMKNMCIDDVSIKDLLLGRGFVEELVRFLVGLEGNELREVILTMLICLVEENDSCRRMCAREDLGLKDYLFKCDEDYEDVRELAKNLRKICFKVK